MADTLSRESSLHSLRQAQNSATDSSQRRSESRGRSFSFMRRQISDDGKVPTRSTSLGRKLMRRRRSSEQSPMDPRPPRLPSMLLTTSDSYQPSGVPLHSSSPYQALNYSRTKPGGYQRHNMDSFNAASVPSIPEASPPSTAYGDAQPYDLHARSESMTNRGRFSYTSTAAMSATGNSRPMRRRKDPTPFNVLVVGSKDCGKTSFIDFLRTALATPIKRRPTTPSPEPDSSQSASHGFFTSHYLETDIEGERIGLTLYDSKGLESHLIDLQLRELTNFLEDKFQETFNEESKVMRATGVRDTHIHCVFLVLDPARLDANIAASKGKGSAAAKESSYPSKSNMTGALDPNLDIGPITALEGKTTVIPIISKADAITTAHMAHLKRTVWEGLRKIQFDPLEALDLDGDDGSLAEEDESDGTEAYDNPSNEEDSSDGISGSPAPTSSQPLTSTRRTNGNQVAAPVPPVAPQNGDARFSAMTSHADLPYLPMSIISPDEHDPNIRGRRFPWGFADCYNSEHCDFTRLKDMVFNEWRSELRTVSREKWYEGWREQRLNKQGHMSSVAARLTSPNARQTSSTLSPPGTQRTVSSAAAYGNLGARQTSGGQARAVSANEIGVAIGDVESHSPVDESNGAAR